LSDAYSHQPNIINKFISVLKREQLSEVDYQESLTKGKLLLENYLNNYPIDSKDFIVDFDFKHDHVHLGDIPLTGKIDLINILDGKNIEVVDFKTGNPDGKYKELSEDGDYFRQLVFYKLLSTLDPNFKYNVTKATIDFVEKSKSKNNYLRKEFIINPEHVEGLKTQIKDIYQKILSQDFYHIGDNCKNKHNLHYLLP
jgi:DNA helicase II / ATP-dependent DNA helicase PcrA